MPNGVAYRDGALYVAEVHRILRYDGIEDALSKVPEPKVVRADLPKDRYPGALGDDLVRDLQLLGHELRARAQR